MHFLARSNNLCSSEKNFTVDKSLNAMITSYMATAGRIQHCAICEKCECRLSGEQKLNFFSAKRPQSRNIDTIVEFFYDAI